jgi:predicted RNase H-like nuclease (RuvC/YqgF family)
MNPSEKTLADFQTRVRQMIFRFQELKKENGRLQALVGEQATEIEELKARVTQADNDYNALKMARMLEITDGNLDEAKERLSRMIRQVNKCIAILSDEQ